MKNLMILSLVCALCFNARSEDDTSHVTFSDDSSVIHLNDSMSLRILKYDTTGAINLSAGVATFNIPAGFKFLDATQSKYVLTELWNNPPSESDGMILPDSAGVIIPGTWAIEVNYEKDGHVKDDDAKEIDYDELLENMQESIREGNKQRKEMGYQEIELLGWASPPYYDEDAKKLHWAKRARFGDDSTEVLNYNIRILGREGVLVLNAIGEMEDLPEIKANINNILNSVNFTEGNRYEDYNESTDKLASYGVGGLIAGGILAKTGILAKIGLLFAKFAKLIIFGVIAAGGFVYRLITGKGKSTNA